MALLLDPPTSGTCREMRTMTEISDKRGGPREIKYNTQAIFILKPAHRLPEIQIELGVLYFHFLTLAALTAPHFLGVKKRL